MNTRLFASLLAVSSIAVFGASCGGSSGEDSGSSSSSAAAPVTLSRAQFVREANSICRRERASLPHKAAEFERISKHPAPHADMVHFVFLPTIERQIFGIERLNVSPAQAVRIDALLRAERRALDSVAVISYVPSITAAVRYFGEADKMLRAYGLSACANGSESSRS